MKSLTLKDELPRSVSAQYATGDQWRSNSRKNEGMEPKQKQYPGVDVTGDRSKVRCCKEQYCMLLLLLLLSCFSRVRLCATSETAAHQAPPSLGFSRQEYWSGLPYPPPGDLPNPRIEPGSPALQADAMFEELSVNTM